MTICRFILAALIWSQLSHAADIEIVHHEPRPFGYVVGDIITRELAVIVKPGYILDEKALPKPGRINTWLEMRSVDVREKTVQTGRHYTVILTYQLPNSPTEVRMVELPAHKFIFLGPGKPIVASSDEWPITLAPITPEQVLARNGLESMRPDIRPAGISTTPMRQRLIGYGLALAAILLFGFYRHFGIPYLSKMRRPFTRAYRDINRLSQQDHSFPQAVERVHKALNETAGRSLFLENVDSFLAHRGIDQGLATLTRQFFELSRDEFFGSGAMDSRRSIAWLLSFCRTWRDVERGVA